MYFFENISPKPLDVATSIFAGAHDVEGIHVTFSQGQCQINIVDHGQNVVGHVC